MTRPDWERFSDIISAIERCQSYAPHLQSGEVRSHGLRRRAAQPGTVIGEAVRALPAETRDQIPDVPWAAIAGLRNVVVHEYFRVDRELILDIVDNQLGPLAERLRDL